jgi:putative flippase GtrA
VDREPSDEGAPGAEPAGARAHLGRLGRHQIASLVATAVDFGTMTVAVELGHVPPALATLFGATLGGLVNFQLGRHFTFLAGKDRAAPQAARYALVSGASAGWNALGELVAHDVLGANYLAARLVVALLVSVLWNYPMQHRFVFRTAEVRT